jgi:DNA-binding NarL/FixJ family response regulator
MRMMLSFLPTLKQARAQLAEHPVAMALVDLGLPDGSGIDLISQLRAADPGMGILVISPGAPRTPFFRRCAPGPTAMCSRSATTWKSPCPSAACCAAAPIDPFIARRIIAELQPTQPTEAHKEMPPEAVLSARELQILKLVADGMTNREIAESLFLSRYTVECHVKNIYRKLAVPSRTKAVSEARARGLLI